jgi:hypothetical protein
MARALLNPAVMRFDEVSRSRACSDCGVIVAEALSPSYAGSEGLVLCWACAVRRGGRYDGELEDWASKPETVGLSGPDRIRG